MESGTQRNVLLGFACEAFVSDLATVIIEISL